MNNKKYVIIAGCSYAYKDVSYIWELLRGHEYELIQLGSSSAGNEFISESVITVLNSLLDYGILAENIFVIINFTQIGRAVVKLPYQYHRKVKNLFEDEDADNRYYANSTIKLSSCKSLIKLQNEIYSFLTTDYNLPEEVKSWFKYQREIHVIRKNIEQHFELYLQCIIITQSFLKKHNINSVSFLMNNVFEGWGSDFTHKYNQHVKLTLPDLTKTKHISEISNYTNALWSCIDLDMFVFHQTKTNKYGGIDEYMLDKHPDRKYFQNPELKNMIFGNHPNNEIYRYFSDDYIADKIKSWLK